MILLSISDQLDGIAFSCLVILVLCFIVVLWKIFKTFYENRMDAAGEDDVSIKEGLDEMQESESFDSINIEDMRGSILAIQNLKKEGEVVRFQPYKDWKSRRITPDAELEEYKEYQEGDPESSAELFGVEGEEFIKNTTSLADV